MNSWPTTTPKGDVVVDVDEGADGGGGGGAGKVMGLALSDDVNTSSALIINCCNNKKMIIMYLGRGGIYFRVMIQIPSNNNNNLQNRFYLKSRIEIGYRLHDFLVTYKYFGTR